MLDQTATLEVTVRKAEIPENQTPQPTLIATTVITNNTSGELAVTGRNLAFELFSRTGKPIEDLPVANLVVENDSSAYTIPPGERVEVRTSLKFEPAAVTEDRSYWLRVRGFDTEVCTEFEFDG